MEGSLGPKASGERAMKDEEEMMDASERRWSSWFCSLWRLRARDAREGFEEDDGGGIEVVRGGRGRGRDEVEREKGSMFEDCEENWEKETRRSRSEVELSALLLFRVEQVGE